MINIGTAHIECPQCLEVIQVPVTAELGRNDDGLQTLICEPDMADVWAHTWGHE